MSVLEQMRRHKDQAFANDPYSPIPPEDREAFTNLNYYPENEALIFTLKIEETSEADTVRMQTSTNDYVTFHRFGQIQFPVNGETQTLTIYRSPEQAELFLPFADATSGIETYGGGRYLEIQPLGGGDYEVDFNQAYNPYCAYSDEWSCPIPPAENRLTVKIEAGEKQYK